MVPRFFIVFNSDFDRKGFVENQIEYSTIHLNLEMFEWQKVLFFVALDGVTVIHNGCFQVIDVIEGFKQKARFFSNSLWVVFHRDIFEREEI